MTTQDGGAPRVTRSQATTAVREAARFALGMALTGALGRGLDAAEFGFVSLVGTIYALAQLALDLGSGALVAREIARDPARERPLLEAVTAWRFVLGLGAAGLTALFAAGEADPERRRWLYAVAASLPLLAPGAAGVVFQVRQDLGPPSFVGVLLQGLMLGGAFYLFDAGAAPATFAALYLVRETAGALSVRLLARFRHGVVLRPGFLRRDTRRLFAGAAAQAGSSLLQTASFHAAPLVVASCRPDADLGVYSAAARLVNPVLLLVGALAAPLLTAAARGYALSRAAAARTAGRAVVLGGWLGAAGAVVVGMGPGGVLALVYGPGRFGEGAAPGEDARAVLALLGVAFAAVCVGAPACTFLLADGGERPLRSGFAWALAANAAFLVAAATGAPLWTAAGGAAAAELVVSWRATRELRRRGALAARAGEAVGPVAAVAVAALATAAAAASSPDAARFAPGVAGVAIAVYALVGGPGRAFRAALREAPV